MIEFALVLILSMGRYPDTNSDILLWDTGLRFESHRMCSAARRDRDIWFCNNREEEGDHVVACITETVVTPEARCLPIASEQN